MFPDQGGMQPVQIALDLLGGDRHRALCKGDVAAAHGLRAAQRRTGGLAHGPGDQRLQLALFGQPGPVEPFVRHEVRRGERVRGQHEAVRRARRCSKHGVQGVDLLRRDGGQLQHEQGVARPVFKHQHPRAERIELAGKALRREKALGEVKNSGRCTGFHGVLLIIRIVSAGHYRANSIDNQTESAYDLCKECNNPRIPLYIRPFGGHGHGD